MSLVCTRQLYVIEYKIYMYGTCREISTKHMKIGYNYNTSLAYNGSVSCSRSVLLFEWFEEPLSAVVMIVINGSVIPPCLKMVYKF